MTARLVGGVHHHVGDRHVRRPRRRVQHVVGDVGGDERHEVGVDGVGLAVGSALDDDAPNRRRSAPSNSVFTAAGEICVTRIGVSTRSWRAAVVYADTANFDAQ